MGRAERVARPRVPRAGRAAIAQSKATGEGVEAVTSRFNGIFFTAFQARCRATGGAPGAPITPAPPLPRPPQFNGAVGLIISSIVFQAIPGDKVRGGC